MDRNPVDEQRNQADSHFIVEVSQGGRRHYVLCEAVLTVDATADVGGLPAELVEQMFDKSPLRAVALPTGRGGRRWLARGGGWPQSGHNVNININLPPDF